MESEPRHSIFNVVEKEFQTYDYDPMLGFSSTLSDQYQTKLGISQLLVGLISDKVLLPLISFLLSIIYYQRGIKLSQINYLPCQATIVPRSEVLVLNDVLRKCVWRRSRDTSYSSRHFHSYFILASFVSYCAF